MREDWIQFKIGDIISENGVFSDGDWIESKDQDPSGEVRLIQLADLGDGYFIDKSNRFLTTEKSKELNCTYLQEGDILLARMPHPLGRASIFPLIGAKKFVTAVDVAIIRLGHNLISNKFMLYNLNSPYSRKKIEELQSGTTRKRISRKNLSKINFPLAPLPEQRAIVAKIEQLFSELDNGIANLKAAKDKLEIYRQAVLKKAFEGEFTIDWRTSFGGQTASELYQEIKDQRDELYTKRIDEWTIEAEQATALGKKKPSKPKKPAIGASLTDEEKEVYAGTPKTWHLLRFIDLIKFEDNGIKRGPFGSAIKKAFFVPQGFKVYEQQNAINDNSTLGTYYLDEKKYQELEKFSVKSGDYIVSCSGTIGRIHKLSEDCEPGVINQALLKIVLDEKLMHSKYFLNLFRSEVFQRRILKGTRGTGMQNLASVDEIKELVIQLPPKDEQLQIIQEIESRLSVCDNILANIEEGLEKSEALRQSILKQAFDGKLLSKAELEACRAAPDWEPAEKLLKRIKNEKLAEA